MKQSDTYIDGYLCPVENAKKDLYREQAESVWDAFREHGATSLIECWGDDVPDGELTSFPMAVKLKQDETVVFSWITWPSKSVRDEAWPKIMADPRMPKDMAAMAVDGKRMIFGGFSIIVKQLT